MPQTSIIKNDQTFHFSCKPGEEPQLVEQMIKMAEDKDCILDIFDVAMMTIGMKKQKEQKPCSP